MPLLGYLENLLRAFLLCPQQLQRMPHFSKFEVRHRRPGNDAALRFLQCDLLCLGLLLHLFGLAAQRLVEDLFCIRHVKHRGRSPARGFRYAVGITCSGTGIEIRHELRLRDLCRMIRHVCLYLRHLNFFAVLQRQLDRALQRYGDRRSAPGLRARLRWFRRGALLRPRTATQSRQGRNAHNGSKQLHLQAPWPQLKNL